MVQTQIQRTEEHIRDKKAIGDELLEVVGEGLVAEVDALDDIVEREVWNTGAAWVWTRTTTKGGGRAW